MHGGQSSAKPEGVAAEISLLVNIHVHAQAFSIHVSYIEWNFPVYGDKAHSWLLIFMTMYLLGDHLMSKDGYRTM